MSQNIFVNYRREDSAGHAGRLFDRLSSGFPGRVFMDVDTLDPGVDFVDAIEQAVGSCEVLIVLIGHEWLSRKDAAGQRRLDDPGDFVRLEVATALERKIRVIPVLVQGASMPRAEQLPPDLAKLARRNAIELSDARWAYDVDRLISTIAEVLKGSEPCPPVAAIPEQKELAPAAPAAPARRRLARSKARIALLAALVLSGGLWTGWKTVKQQATQRIAVPAPAPATRIATNSIAVPAAYTPALESAKSRMETKKSEERRVGTHAAAVPAAPAPVPESAKSQTETKKSEEHRAGTRKSKKDVVEIDDIIILDPYPSPKPEDNKPPRTI